MGKKKDIKTGDLLLTLNRVLEWVRVEVKILVNISDVLVFRPLEVTLTHHTIDEKILRNFQFR